MEKSKEKNSCNKVQLRKNEYICLKQENLSGERGITLITLVVTIIILLILAAVALAMLKGENGLITRAQESKIESEKAKEEEKIKMALNGSIDENYNGKVNGENLKQTMEEELGDEAEFTDNGGSYFVKFKDSERTYTITEDGEILEGEVRDIPTLKLDKQSISLKPEETATIVATTNLPENLTWTSSNTGIVSIPANSNGKTTLNITAGQTEGNCTITAKVEKTGEDGVTRTKTATCTINVVQEKINPTGITLSLIGSRTIDLSSSSKTRSITATITPLDANVNTEITWSSSNSNVAIVSGNGSTATITGKANGSTTITATTGNGVSSSYSIVCETSITGISLNIENEELMIGDSLELVATVSPSNTTQKLTWITSNSGVVDINVQNQKAAVKAKSTGTVTITVKNPTGTISKTCTITCKVIEGKIAKENVTYTDSEGKKAIIPAGFSVVKGAEPISQGLVISDVENDDINNSKGGNQFVWIPVDGIDLKYETHTYATPITNDEIAIADTGNGEWGTYKYRNYTGWIDDGENAESVEANKGFYIARFEAGIPKNAPFYNDTDGLTYWQSYYSNDTLGSNSLTEGSYVNTYMSKNVTTYMPVSKKNNPSWNSIAQPTAKIVAGKMYEGSNSVISSLVDGYAWDTVTQWLSNSGYNVVDSTSWGNHFNSSFAIDGLYAKHEVKRNKNGILDWFPSYTWSKGTYTKSANTRTEIATGSVERNKANNIYDFAGNMYEWSTEIRTDSATSTTFDVLRGGGFHDTGNITSAAVRHGNNNADREIDPCIGFRVVLYIK